MATNSLDQQYQDLLEYIIGNGVEKEDRTGTGTLSKFGMSIRHRMSDGFPILTTKRMPLKIISTEFAFLISSKYCPKPKP